EGVESPESAAPGGIGLVSEGSVGAYLFEDPGDPRAQGWKDPSNRKVFLRYDPAQHVFRSNERSLISDGVTLRLRFRLTPAERARDVPQAPKGYPTENGAKGMFTLVHYSKVTLTGSSQGVAIAMDMNAADPGKGILRIASEAGELAIPIPDPTQWLDLW